MPSPSWPVARYSRGSAGHGPISGSLSGVAARKPVQVRIAESCADVRHVLLRPLQHAAQHVRLDGAVLSAELARRTQQHLPGPPRLRVEGHRIGGGRVGALQIAELHQHCAHEAGIAVGNRQVALALAHLDAGRQLGRPCAGGVHRDAGRKKRAIAPAGCPRPLSSTAALRAPLPRPIAPGNSGRRRAGKPPHRRARAGRPPGRAAGAVRLRPDCAASSTSARTPVAVIDRLLAPDFGHLFLIGGHPDGAAGQVFGVRRQLRPQGDPQCVARER